MPAFQQLTPPAVEPSDKPISLADFKCIGSYTWIEGRDPVIVVPGMHRWFAILLFDMLTPGNADRFVRRPAAVAGPPSSHPGSLRQRHPHA